MSKNKKWHQFVNVQVNENHQHGTDTMNDVDRNNSNSNNFQQIDNSKDIKTLDSSDKKQNDEQNQPTLKPNPTSRPRPNLEVDKLKNRLSLKCK